MQRPVTNRANRTYRHSARIQAGLRQLRVTRRPGRPTGDYRCEGIERVQPLAVKPPVACHVAAVTVDLHSASSIMSSRE